MTTATAATVHEAANVHAELARERKAIAWADLFERFSMNAEQVEAMTDPEWKRIAKAANLNVPRTSKPLIIARLRSRAVPAEHEQDADCTLDADGTCTACHVTHGEACPDCGARGYHAATCPMSPTGEEPMLTPPTEADYARVDALAASYPMATSSTRGSAPASKAGGPGSTPGTGLSFAESQRLNAERKDFRECSFCDFKGVLETHLCEEKARVSARAAELRAADVKRIEERQRAQYQRDMDALEGRNRMAEAWGAETFRCPVCLNEKKADQIGALTSKDPLCRECVATGLD